MKMVKILSLCATILILCSCVQTNPCSTCEVAAQARPADYNASNQRHAAKSSVKKLPTYSYSGKSLTQRKTSDSNISA